MKLHVLNSRKLRFNSGQSKSEQSLDGVYYSDLTSAINPSNQVNLYEFLKTADKNTELFELWYGAGGSGMSDHKIKVSDILKGWRVARVYKTKYGYVATSLPVSPDPDLGSNYVDWNEAKSKLGIPSVYPKDFTGGSWQRNSRLHRLNSRKYNSDLVSDEEFARIVEESGFQTSTPNQFRSNVSDINLSNAEKEYWDTRDWIQSGNVHGSQLGFEQIRLKYAKKLMELAKI